MNLCKLFNEHAGKPIKVKMKDGEVISGLLSCYISANDNDPEPECIIVGNIELPEDEIEEIEIDG